MDTTLQFLSKKFLTLYLPVFVVILILVYNWRRRWLYYYGSKIPGPFAFPLLGSVHLVIEGPDGIYKFLKNLFKTYPSVVKVWLGNGLYVSTTKPNHVKTLLSIFLQKGDFYQAMLEYFGSTLTVAPVNLWKYNKRLVTPAFSAALNPTTIKSFVKHSEILVSDLKFGCGKEVDAFALVWKCVHNAGCENLTGVDPDLIDTGDFLGRVLRIEEILLQRFFNPILYLNFFWRCSSLRKELLSIMEENYTFVKQIVKLRKLSWNNNAEKMRFLDHLLDLVHNEKISHDYMLEEVQITLAIGTETSAATISATLLLLGMHPEIQDKIDVELDAIFGGSNRKATLEDVEAMGYLEQVINETMRLIPPIPFVVRKIDENIQLDSYVFPAGAEVILPITEIQRDPNCWIDPLKFDPDRFSPDESEKIASGSFIPFSYGSRNCLGKKYAMLSMKTIVSTILRNYRIKSSNYKSVGDIDFLIYLAARPKNGYKVTLEHKKEIFVK